MANFQIKDFPTSSSSLRNDQILMQTLAGVTRKTDWDVAGFAVRGQVVHLIEQESDFPTQDATTITCSTGAYIINGTIVTSKRFIIPDGNNVTFFAYDTNLGLLIYTGTGNMFTPTDSANVTFINVLMSAPLGTWIYFNPGAAQLSTIYVDTCVLYDCANLGSVSNIATLVFIGCAALDCGNGITVSDTTIFSFTFSQFFGWKNNSTSYFTTGTGIRTMGMSNSLFVPNTNETVLNSTAGDVTNGAVIGNSIDLSAGGTFFAAGGIDSNNINWKFVGNLNILDSIADAELSLTNNTTITSVAAVNIPTLIAGTWIDSAERFTTTSTGKATYIGLDDISLSVSANPEAVLETGTNKDVSFYFVKGNNTTNTITAVSDQGGGIIRFTTGNPHGLITGNRVKIIGTTNYNNLYTITVIDATHFDVTGTFVSSQTGNWKVVIERSKSANQLASTTKASNTSVLTLKTFKTNDFIELFVSNNSDGTGIKVRNCNIIIS